jgi:hypothetical protein
MGIRRKTVLLFAVVSMLGSVALAAAQSVTLAWDRNTESDVTGYRVFYGTQSQVYAKSVDVGNTTTYTVSGLDVSLNYYFAVQAYNSQGLSSSLSSEVELPAAAPPGTTVIKSLTANASSPLLLGKPVTWTAQAVSQSGPVEYRFLLFSPQGVGWVQLQDYSQKSSVTWTPAWTDIGPHVVQVWARTVGSAAQYEAWVSSDQFTVNANPVQITADVDFPTPPGNPVHWTTSVAGADTTPLEYRDVMLNQTTGVWSELRGYTTDSHFTWTPAATGNYVIQAWARKVGSQAAYDVWGTSGWIAVSRAPLRVSSFAVDTSVPTTTGTTMTWTARAQGGTQGPLEYRFVRYSDAKGWEEVQAYSTSNTYTWTPQWGEQGKYHLQVWVRNAGSTAEYDAWKGTTDFDVRLAALQVSVDKVFPVPPGTPVTLTGTFADPQQAIEYRFVMYDRSTGTWSEARPYGTTNTYTWTPTKTGSFVFEIWARKVGSTAEYDAWRGTDYLPVAIGPAHVVSLKADTSLSVSAGTPITWTAVANGGTVSPIQYRFVLYTEGLGWTELRNWSPSNTLTWTPSGADIGRQHVVQVWVRSYGSAAEYEDWTRTPFFEIR